MLERTVEIERAAVPPVLDGDRVFLGNPVLVWLRAALWPTLFMVWANTSDPPPNRSLAFTVVLSALGGVCFLGATGATRIRFSDDVLVLGGRWLPIETVIARDEVAACYGRRLAAVSVGIQSMRFARRALILWPRDIPDRGRRWRRWLIPDGVGIISLMALGRQAPAFKRALAEWLDDAATPVEMNPNASRWLERPS